LWNLLSSTLAPFSLFLPRTLRCCNCRIQTCLHCHICSLMLNLPLNLPLLFLFPHLIFPHVAAMSTLHLRAATSAVLSHAPLGFPFKTLSPFLFCVYHHDNYPAGDALMQAPRKGNGADFDWSQPYRPAPLHPPLAASQMLQYLHVLTT
jgi:hypothetical protein